ncbi:BspA family leucine-rich repeat surface protein, partial [Helicobacter bizzozeronii]
HSMFEGCQNFNQPLNDWDISSVKNMAGMFFKCANFNQSLENWNVSSATEKLNMFYNCPALTTLPHWYRA